MQEVRYSGRGFEVSEVRGKTARGTLGRCRINAIQHWQFSGNGVRERDQHNVLRDRSFEEPVESSGRYSSGSA